MNACMDSDMVNEIGTRSQSQKNSMLLSATYFNIIIFLKDEFNNQDHK